MLTDESIPSYFCTFVSERTGNNSVKQVTIPCFQEFNAAFFLSAKIKNFRLEREMIVPI